MKVVRTEIPEVLVLAPEVFEDARGTVFESWNRRAFAEATGVAAEFVQDNLSVSRKNVVRGLHYQVAHPQGKLIIALRGEIFDVAVDIRRSSRSYGAWVGFALREEGPRMAWIPAGFAHGFSVVSESAEVLYKLTDFRYPEHERVIRWDDPAIAVRWPLAGAPVLSPRDAAAPGLAQAETYP